MINAIAHINRDSRARGQDAETVYLLLEYCAKGELYQLLRPGPGGPSPKLLIHGVIILSCTLMKVTLLLILKSVTMLIHYMSTYNPMMTLFVVFEPRSEITGLQWGAVRDGAARCRCEEGVRGGPDCGALAAPQINYALVPLKVAGRARQQAVQCSPSGEQQGAPTGHTEPPSHAPYAPGREKAAAFLSLLRGTTSHRRAPTASVLL